MKSLVIVVLLAFIYCCPAQEIPPKEESQIRLVNWSSQDCDNTYDPYRLQNRITSFESKNGISSITVNFSDNCCADFEPKIEIKGNRLMLIPYEKYIGDFCACNCCFSITFLIGGIQEGDYEVYFADKKIEVSNDHYKTVVPSYEMYEGKIINRKNKYGFAEGFWISFFENGNQKYVTKFPESSLYFDSHFEWSKGFNELGKLTYYERKDTSESWFDDGELKSQIIDYSSGDTTFEKGFKKFDNRQLQKRYLERYYPIIITSEFDSTYKGTGARYDYLYKEEYYSNGQPKFLQEKDTSYTWFENGIVQFKRYESGELKYSEQGRLIKRYIRWKEPGIKKPGVRGGRDMDNSLHIKYYENGDIQKIVLSRDEPLPEGGGYSPGASYRWEWDEKLNLINSPKNWSEVFPWKKIVEIKLSPTKYKLH